MITEQVQKNRNIIFEFLRGAFTLSENSFLRLQRFEMATKNVICRYSIGKIVAKWVKLARLVVCATILEKF